MADESLMLASGAAVAAAGAIPALAAYIALRRRGQRVFPICRRWFSPWNGLGVVAAFLAAYLLPPIVAGLIDLSGFLPAKDATATVRQLWAWPLAFAIVVAAIAGVRAASARLATRPPSEPARPASAVVAAYMGWLVLTPVVFGVFGLAILSWRLATGKPPDAHPLTHLGPESGWSERVLLVLQAVVFAPVLEELLFRGALLAWSVQRPSTRAESAAAAVPHAMRSHLVVALSLAAALARGPGFADGSVRRILEGLAPFAFVLALVPAYWWLPRWKWLGRKLRMRSQRSGRAVVSTAMLFAAVHTPVWPTPVPLFVLALGLGYVAVRTRGVLAPIMVHALFNGVSVLYLLLGGTS